MDALWAQVFADEHKSREKRPVGEGWKTFAEIHKESGRGLDPMHRVVTQMVRDGRLEMFKGLVLKDAKLVRQVWYRPIVPKLSQRTRSRGKKDVLENR